MKNTGLTDREWEQIRNVLYAVPAIEKAVLFGSRAMGLARGNSDVDIMLYGDGLTLGDVAHVRALLEETTLPYQFDLVLNDARNKSLQEHVRQYGKVIAKNVDVPSSSWREYNLEDCLDALIDYRGKTPNKTDYGIPLITAKIIKEGKILPATEFISNSEYEQWMRRGTPKSGDIVLTTEAPLGEVAQLGNKKVALAQRVVALRGKKGFLDSTFLLYLLQTEDMQEKLNARATGTTVLGIKQSELRKIPVAVPPLPFQIQAASHLKVLDARIQLLRETNATLEAIAQALFKSWFVDFDPVHARAEGRIPEGMDAETVALFPSEFEESELGMIPRGWRVAPIGEHVTIVGGGTPSTKNPGYWTPEEHAWTSPKDLSGLSSPVLLSTEKKISSAGLGVISSGLLPAGTFLLSSRAPIGYLAITEIPLAINQGYIAVKPESELPPLFMYFWCKLNMETIKGYANGSTFMEISKKSFRLISAIIPDNSVVDACLPGLHRLFERIAINEKQAQTLAALRDTLLPRLISGKLRLPEFVEPFSEAPE